MGRCGRERRLGIELSPCSLLIVGLLVCREVVSLHSPGNWRVWLEGVATSAMILEVSRRNVWLDTMTTRLYVCT